MRIKILANIILLSLTISVFSQKPFCADSSIRIKYVFNNTGASLFNNPDTAGTNFYTGEYLEGGKYGIALLKTTWGDSIIWSKKIYSIGKDIANRNSYDVPDGTKICTGIWGGAVSNRPELLISRIDAMGNLQWAKRFKLNQNHLYYDAGNFTTKNILIANNSIYFVATIYFNNQPYDYSSVITKLDINGNVIWSKDFRMNLPVSSMIIGEPVYHTNAIVILCNARSQQLPGPGSEPYSILTKINDLDGSIVESNAYKTIPDTFIKGISSLLLKSNADNSLSLTGQIMTDPAGNGYYNLSDNIFNIALDGNLMVQSNNYYRNYLPLNNIEIYAEFNNQKQHAILGQANNNNRDKYFITFGKNNELLRSRKFNISSALGTPYRNSVNLDDKQNLHFLYHYNQGGKLVTEYARISNLAPNGTLGCFGKDTSILTQYPFTITKQPFTWDNIQSDVIVSNDVPYTEDTAIVTKQLVCKIVSYCDSMHISGPATVCINQPVRYTVNKNNGCFKNSDWVIDTSFANIINTEGDSAISISFKKPFAGYIHAAITDCVVKDSFFVKTVPPKKLKFANRDSLLCPGKSITLKADSLYRQYQWQDGSTADSLLITGPGFYKLTATDFCGYQSADSITIKFSDSTLNIPATQAICKYDTAFITLPPDVNNITWQPFTNALLNNKTLLLYPLQSTVYSITAERLANCPITKTTAVTVTRCPEIVFLPNAFTPDNNGLNDVFKASSFRPLTYFRLAVFNRYGQKLFETNNITAGWDGNYKGSKQPTGGYVYQCSYGFASGYQKTEGGYFMLLR